jgi:hypothetical protein
MRPSSLPPYVSPPSASVGLEGLQRHVPPGESLPESEQHAPAGRKDKDKRSSMLSSLFRKKRATHL